MGQINVHEFISLDGVVEDPRWTMDFPFDPKMGETISQFMGPSKAILLGRRTYEMFYPAWSTRSADDDPGAPFFNETAKYVVSGTLETAEWNNSQILGAYDPNAIRNLKEQVDGDIYVSGSISLVRAMIADGLVDGLHLFVYPVSLGAGLKLFDEGDRAKFELTGSQAYDSGVLYAAYRPLARRDPGDRS